MYFQVDAKKDIRSELKELVAAEEEAMVKLSEQIKSSALEEKRVKKKLGSENVISREIEENNHQVSSMIDWLIDWLIGFSNSFNFKSVRVWSQTSLFRYSSAGF